MISQVFIISIVITYLSYNNSVKSVNSVTDEYIGEVNSRVYNILEDFFYDAEKAITFKHKLFKNSIICLDERESVFKYFLEYIKIHKNLNSIYYGSSDGGIINAGHERNEGYFYTMYTDNNKKGNLYKLKIDNNNPDSNQIITVVNDFDATVRPWFINAVNSDSIAWSEPYLLSTGNELAITVSKALRDENNDLKGVIAADLFLSYISEFMSEIQVGDSGNSFIIDNSGFLIADSKGRDLFELINDSNIKRLRWDDFYKSKLNLISKYFYEKYSSLDLINEEISFKFNHQNSDFMVKILPFKFSEKFNWFIISVIPESDFLEKIYLNNQATLRLSLLFLILSIILSIISSDIIIKPILNLNYLTKKISQGLWIESIEESSIIEINELGDKFLKMSKELKKQNEFLSQAKITAENADKAKSEFLANMSHEIRTPLTAIIGFTDVMMGDEKDEEKNQYLEIVNNAANTLLILINDILDYSKLVSGKMDLENIETDIYKLIDEIIKMERFNAEKKKLKLNFSIKSNVPKYIYIDPTRIKQILLNLINNAVKFTGEGEISLDISFIKTDTPGFGNFIFEVKDTGIGITEENIEKLFESFVQADSTVTRKYGGTGLGLAISNKLAKLMGSEINIESIPGKGSTFSFKITTQYKAVSRGSAQ